jgi:CHASE3 domain sensor protein
MFAWTVGRRGMTQLVMTYFALAAVALVIAVSAFAISAQHSNASGQETLQLNITRYHG